MLGFPNQSRSYQATTDRISFWGHDGASEVAFFLGADALFRLYPRTGRGEAAILAAFDAARERIHEVAGRAYAGSQRRFYVLGADSF